MQAMFWFEDEGKDDRQRSEANGGGDNKSARNGRKNEEKVPFPLGRLAQKCIYMEVALRLPSDGKKWPQNVTGGTIKSRKKREKTTT